MNKVSKFLQGPFLDWGNKWNPWIAGTSGVLLASAPYLPLNVESKEPLILSWMVAFGVAGIAVTTCIAGVSARFQKTRKSLEEELRTTKTKLNEVAINMDYLFRGLLVNLWNLLGLKSEHQARISIYMYDNDADGEEGRFACCGRYSHNPQFRKPGRSSYPDRQGYIREGWSKGWHYDDQFPPDEEACRQYHRKKYGIPPDILRNFKMLPRFAVVRRLDDNESKSQAIIVIEGENETCPFDEKTVKNRLEELAPSYAHMVKVLREHISLPEDAKEKDL